MITSYTLARVLPAKEEEVYKKVKTYPEVREAVLTYGEYDLLLRVEANSLEELDNFIFNKLRTTSGILATTTLIEAKPKRIVGGG
ncbi:MAG: Lrp/AsnC ligand binding domain-containing protein [Candidatus Bathyarchaeia archaeon]|nr:Lrp/AsnC ligand binding domain-containing protein [Candidatus Bathyarchaeota archaeon]